MILHIYFNCAKFLYSIVSRRDHKFVIWEAVSSIVLAALAIIFYYPLNAFLLKLIESVFNDAKVDTQIIYLIESLVIGALFTGSSFYIRIIFPRNPVEVPEKSKRKPKTPIGIIDFVWLSLMGVAYVVIIFLQTSPTISHELIPNQRWEYYSLYYDEVNLILKESIRMILVLGTVLAACMTILWSGQLWQKRDPSSKREYGSTAVAAKKMVIAFLFIAIANGIWVCLPLYSRIVTVKLYLVP